MRRWIAAALTWAMAPLAAAADLSPGGWPAAERARLEAMETSPFPPAARTVVGRRELVAGTLSPVAVHAGMEALRQGGTAADAAVTVALTQVATNLGAVVSYAGVAQLVYYDASTRRTYALDAGWGTYAAESDPRSIPAPDLGFFTGEGAAAPVGPQGRKTLVPGFMAGMAAMHGRFGRLPFADLFAPSIWYAESGVTVTPLLSAYFGLQRPQLARTEEGRRFLGQGGGDTPKVGARFVQPQVAGLLRGIAANGPRHMYEGPWAAEYVALVRREGGAATLDDLRAYRPTWETPASVRFGDATVIGPGTANPSGCAVLTALNLLDALGSRDLGPYWTDAAAFTAQARSVRLANIAPLLPAIAALERDRGLKSGCEGQLQPAWGRAVAPELNRLLAAAGPAGGLGHHSASVVVVDRFGNVAALVHSINSIMWGDTGIVAGGVPISGAAAIYRQRMVGLKPGAHVPGGMAPVIAMRGGRPVVAAASVGSSLAPETVRMAAGLLDGRDIQALSAAPPLISPFLSGEIGAETIPVGAYGPELKAALAAQGVKLTEAPPARIAALRGTAPAAVRGPDGSWRAAEVPGVVTFGDAR